MKKFILISFCLCVILGVILLNRGRNVNVDIVSKYFVNGNKTFYYPLFNRENIDNYIWEYLNSNMDYGDKLFLDYDYRDNEEGVTITFYFYGENDMGVRYKRESLYVDMGNERVKRVDTQDNSITSYRALNKKRVNILHLLLMMVLTIIVARWLMFFLNGECEQRFLWLVIGLSRRRIFFLK